MPVIGSDIAAALPELQAQAESLMVDTVEIRDEPTRGPADPTTGVRSTVLGTLRYSGKCRIRRQDNLANAERRAEQNVKVARYVLTVPVDAVAYPGDTATVTASADQRLLNGIFTVQEPVDGTFRFQRRLFCVRDT